jgi:hypothetical protein
MINAGTKNFHYVLLQEIEFYINKKATLISSSCEKKIMELHVSRKKKGNWK